MIMNDHYDLHVALSTSGYVCVRSPFACLQLAACRRPISTSGSSRVGRPERSLLDEWKWRREGMAEPTRRNTAVVFTAGTTFCFSRVMQLGGGISTTIRTPVLLAVRALSALWWMFSGAKGCQQCAAVFPPHQKGVVVSSDRMCASLTLLLLRHELFRVHIVQFMIILRQVVGVPTFFLAVGATCFHSLIYHGHFSQSAYGVSSELPSAHSGQVD